MAGLFGALGVAGTALAAQQRGMLVTGHNIANTSTPGYHRQRLGLEALAPGLGVRAHEVTRAMDDLTERRLDAEAGTSGFAETRARELGGLESELGAGTQGSLPSSLSSFFASWRELASAPGDTVARAQTLARAENLAGRVRAAAAAVANRRAAIDREIVGEVEQANRLIESIAELSRAVATATAAGKIAPDLEDARDAAVRSLAELTGATVLNTGGAMTVTIGGGVVVVQGGEARRLSVQVDAGSGLHHVRVEGGAGASLDARLSSGSLGGLLTTRDQELVSRATTLDAFAGDLAAAVNAVHSAGVGLDGLGGRNLFSVAGGAAGLSVDAALSGRPDRLAAAADAAALPGDARAAQALVALEQQKLALAGTATLGESLIAADERLGAAVRAASDAAAASSSRAAELVSLREAVSGVSVEEEMIALSRYQRAFEAATRIVRTVDEMLDVLMRM